MLFCRKPDEFGRISKAAISDICYDPEMAVDSVDALIDGCLQLAVERRAGGLVIDIVDDLVEERLKKKGFWRVKGPLQLLVRSEQERPVLFDPDAWFLTRGDSDISIFEDPNAI